jgi:hypothetical protein
MNERPLMPISWIGYECFNLSAAVIMKRIFITTTESGTNKRYPE